MDRSRSSLRRWRIATAISAATSVVLALREPAPADRTPTPAGLVRTADDAPPSILRQLHGQLRNPVDETALLARIRTARTAGEIQKLCTQLGFVGSDASVGVLSDLAHDPRWEVGRAAITALGRIGTERAVDVLVGLSTAGPSWQVRSALSALAEAGTVVAHDRVVAAALEPGRFQPDAIGILDELGTGDVIEALRSIAGDRDPETTVAVIATAARLGTDEGDALVLGLTDSADRTIRAAALRAIALDDPAALPVLIKAAGGDDPAAAAAAAEALGNARERSAVPMLAHLARAGGKDARTAAVEALATIGDPPAMATLTEMAGGTGPTAAAAARALGLRGDDAAARALLDALAAQPAGTVRTDLLNELQNLPGDAVDTMFHELAASGTGQARVIALAHLETIRDPDVIPFATDLAAQGGRGSWDGVTTLARSDDPEAYAALVGLATHDDGIGADALDALVSRRNGGAEVTSLLAERLRGGRAEQIDKAAAGLAEAGTPAARTALLDILHGADPARAAAVAGVLLDAGPEGVLRDELTEVARRDPRPAVRSKAVGKLVEAGADGAADLARQALLHGNTELAQSMVGELKGQDGPAALGLLATAARDGQAYEVRADAVTAIASRNDPATTGLLAELAADPQIRDTALAGLADLDTDAAIDRVLALSPRGTAEAEQALIARLRWSIQPAAHDALADYITGGDPTLAVSAIEGVYKQSGTIDTALRAALASPDEAVATAAARRLREVGAGVSPAERARIASLIGP